MGLDLPNYAVFGGEDICKARRSNGSNPFGGQREVILAIILRYTQEKTFLLEEVQKKTVKIKIESFTTT